MSSLEILSIVIGLLEPLAITFISTQKRKVSDSTRVLSWMAWCGLSIFLFFTVNETIKLSICLVLVFGQPILHFLVSNTKKK